MERWSSYSPKKWDFTPTGKLNLRYDPWVRIPVMADSGVVGMTD